MASCSAPAVVPSPDAAPDSFEGVVARLSPIVKDKCIAEARVARCDFQLLVVRSRAGEANAFQTVSRRGQPFIIVTTDLLAELRNPDELALVLAHEAAHHILNHLGQQAELSRLGAEIFAEAAREQGLTGKDMREAIEVGAFVGQRAFSKEFELEADAMGAELSQAAGYDPVRAAAYYQRLPAPGDGAFGTHPENDLRRRTVLQAVQ